ncbi:hypothetical protein ACMFMF_006799 [Clarireedia jacksonii]
MTRPHSQNQTSGGSYHCGYLGCDKTFTRRTGARRHETLVHSDKKIFCQEPYCNYRGGKRRNDFKKHMREKHPGHDEHLYIPEDFSTLRMSSSPPAQSVENDYCPPEVNELPPYTASSTSTSGQIDPRKEPVLSATQIEAVHTFGTIMAPPIYSSPPRPPDYSSRLAQTSVLPDVEMTLPAVFPMHTPWESCITTPPTIAYNNLDGMLSEGAPFGYLAGGQYQAVQYGQSEHATNVDANCKW